MSSVDSVNGFCGHRRPLAGLALGALLGLGGCAQEVGEGYLTAIVPDPSSVEFGSVRVGQAASTEVLIRNVGDRAVRIEVFEETPSAAIRFELDRMLVPAGDAAVLAVSFTPTDPGDVRGRLLIRTPDALSVPDLPLPFSGRGVDHCGLQLTPERVDFGSVVVGTTASRRMSVTNTCETPTSLELHTGDNLKLCSQGMNNPAEFCVRSRDRSIDQDNRFEIAAGASAEFEVKLAPAVAGARTDGHFELATCALPVCKIRVELVGNGIASALRCRPAAVDFGAVNPGASARQSLTCENVGQEPVALVSWATTPDSHPTFAVEMARPQVLNGGESVALEVSFAPVALGDVAGTLRIETDASSARTLDVPLRGTGGGPSIQVRPSGLDFGRVTLIAPARRSLVLINIGFAPLLVSEIRIDTAGTRAFTSPDANASVISPGEAQTVTIELSPRAVGEIVSAVRVLSNDREQPALEVPLRGEGVNLPPCTYSVAPTRLDFGAVERTRALRRTFEIRNEGADLCLVTAARVSSRSDPAFSLPGEDVRSLEIPPGEAETIAVDFAPTAVGTVTGQVEFSISSPSSPFYTVDLSGVGTD